GRRSTASQNRSLPKQLNSTLSTGSASDGSSEEISSTVGPKPLAYCVVTRTGSSRIPASRNNIWTLLTSRSRSCMGGSSFSWMSTTTSAQLSAANRRRAASSAGFVLSNVPVKVTIVLASQVLLAVYSNYLSLPATY